jgi:hypothetical protein
VEALGGDHLLLVDAVAGEEVALHRVRDESEPDEVLMF